jgi:hypothetical protein
MTGRVATGTAAADRREVAGGAVATVGRPIRRAARPAMVAK